MKKRRGNTRYFAIFTLVIIAAVIIIKLSSVLLHNLDIFLIKDIQFNGNITINEDCLINAGSELIGKNLFHISESEIKKLFNAISRLEDLEISRRFPGKLLITIIERIPVFQIKTIDGKIKLVDDKGFMVSESETSLLENLPIISLSVDYDSLAYGKKVNDPFLNFLLNYHKNIKQIEPDFYDYISEIFPIKENICVVEYQKGYRVIIDRDDFLNGISEFMDIKNTCSFDSDTIIDMTYENNYLVTRRGN